MSVYLDNVIYEEITLYRTMPLKEYSIDVSDAKHLRIFIDREGNTGYGFGDVKIDSKDPVSKHIIPSYGTNTDFMKSTFDSNYFEIYDGASPKVYNFNMNGKVYDKAILMYGYFSDYDSELNINVEKLDKIKFRIGHIEGKGNAAARLSIKKDNVLHETIDLTSGMDYIDYTLDVKGLKGFR